LQFTAWFDDNADIKESVESETEFGFNALGGAVVTVPEPQPLSQAHYSTLSCILVNGIMGITYHYIRPEPKPPLSWITQRRDEQGNFCKQEK